LNDSAIVILIMEKYFVYKEPYYQENQDET